MNNTSMELYLDHLNEWGGAQPEIHQASPEGTEPPTFTFTYRNVIGDNSVSGFTYGLSLVSHPDSRLVKPELFISMDSENSEWVLAAGYVATAWRGEEYSVGDVFSIGAPISSDESSMSALLLFLVADLEPEFTHIELPDVTINLVQLYPIYESEIVLVEQQGAAEFLSTAGVDFHDPWRPPLTH